MIKCNIIACLLVEFRVDLHTAALDSAGGKAQTFKNIYKILKASGDTYCKGHSDRDLAGVWSQYVFPNTALITQLSPNRRELNKHFLIHYWEKLWKIELCSVCLFERSRENFSDVSNF